MKKSLLAMALAASMTTATLASDQQTLGFANNAFTQTDIQALFGQDGQHATVQLASLPAQEMQETEGAWLPLAGAAIGGLGGFSGYYLENRLSGSQWSWVAAGFAVADGIGRGAVAGPVSLAWTFPRALGRGAVIGLAQNFGY